MRRAQRSQLKSSEARCGSCSQGPLQPPLSRCAGSRHGCAPSGRGIEPGSATPAVTRATAVQRHGEPLRDLAREWEGGCPLPCSGPHGSAGGKRVGGAGVAWLGPPGADAGAHAWLCRGTGLSKACDNARPTLNPIRSISLQVGLASVTDGRQRATSGGTTATEGVLTSLSAASPSVLGLC